MSVQGFRKAYRWRGYVRGGLYTQNRKGALKQAIAVLTKIHLDLLAFNTKLQNNRMRIKFISTQNRGDPVWSKVAGCRRKSPPT